MFKISVLEEVKPNVVVGEAVRWVKRLPILNNTVELEHIPINVSVKLNGNELKDKDVIKFEQRHGSFIFETKQFPEDPERYPTEFKFFGPDRIKLGYIEAESDNVEITPDKRIVLSSVVYKPNKYVVGTSKKYDCEVKIKGNLLNKVDKLFEIFVENKKFMFEAKISLTIYSISNTKKVVTNKLKANQKIELTNAAVIDVLGARLKLWFAVGNNIPEPIKSKMVIK